MNARVVKTDFQTGRETELTNTYREVIGSGENETGFQGAVLLADSKTGKSISITFWNSEAELTATEQSGWWQKQIDKFKGVFTSTPVREHYDVIYSRFPAGVQTHVRPAAQEERPPRVQ